MTTGNSCITRPLIINLDVSTDKLATPVPIDCVLDVNRFGEVIGMGIMNLACNTAQRPHGRKGLAKLGSGEKVRWSYDEEADVFYSSIKEDQSLDQRCTRCTVAGTNEGYLARVTVAVKED